MIQGITWTTPTGSPTSSRIADVYVDDATLWTKPTKEHTLITTMINNFERYHEMLTWTGGALNLEKCFFLIMIWAFTAEGLPYLTEDVHQIKIKRTPQDQTKISRLTQQLHESTQNQATIIHELQQLTGISSKHYNTKQYAEICHTQSTEVILKQLGSQDSQKTLGLYMTTSGNMTEVEKKFEAKNQQYGLRIVQNNLQPPEIKRAHMAVHLPSQTYCFNGPPFTQEFLNRETNKTTSKVLPKLGIARTHPTALRHAPKNRGGLELPHYYTIQGTILIKQIIRHLRLQSSLGKLMFIHLTWTQLNTGLQNGILTDTNANINYVPSNWWTHVRKFLQHIQGRIDIEQPYTISPLQVDDQSIMEEIQKQTHWTTYQLRLINAVRIYMQVTYLSELMTTGTYLEMHVINNQQPRKWSRSKMKWPRQIKPGKVAWKYWRKALRQLCGEDGRTLKQPLQNEWYPVNTHNRQWRYRMTPNKQMIYDTYDQIQYRQVQSGRRQHIYALTGKYQDIPNRSIPIQPQRHKQTLIMQSQDGTIIEPNHSDLQRPDKTEVTPTPYAQYAVSDGSVAQGRGTFGWVQATKNEITQQQYGHVEGTPGNMTSFRAEAQGLADLIYQNNITSKTKIFLDNQAVIKKVNQDTPLHPHQAEWELLEPVRHRVQTERLNVQYVKGHQNIKHPKTKWNAKLNHEADKLATHAHTQPTRPGYLPRGYRVMLYIQDLPVTTKYNAEIIRASHTPEIRDYYHQKYQWSDKTMATLDWDAYNRAMKRMKTSEERTLHKFTHNWLPTGNHMAKRYHTENKCPHCQQPENNRHIVNCPKQKEQQEKFYRNLAKRLEAIHTDNTLKNLLLNSLQGKELSVKNDHKNKHWMEQLIQEQNQIGIQNLWLGHLTQTWGDIQEHIYRTQGKHHSLTGTRWAKIVITQILKYVLSC